MVPIPTASVICDSWHPSPLPPSIAGRKGTPLPSLVAIRGTRFNAPTMDILCPPSATSEREIPATDLLPHAARGSGGVRGSGGDLNLVMPSPQQAGISVFPVAGNRVEERGPLGGDACSSLLLPPVVRMAGAPTPRLSSPAAFSGVTCGVARLASLNNTHLNKMHTITLGGVQEEAGELTEGGDAWLPVDRSRRHATAALECGNGGAGSGSARRRRRGQCCTAEEQQRRGECLNAWISLGLTWEMLNVTSTFQRVLLNQLGGQGLWLFIPRN
ncbi:uncharacterized protein [Miscanthus floridulus]|uniref:uncharacterized protein n=1 Tax=Miscanthus floridulus TaxID=154761 RepID=UPI00345A33B9